YLIARHLFDDRLAILAVWLVLLCDAMWRSSISGLPQMLMLFLFNGTLYTLVRAMLAQSGGGRVGPWLALAGVGFGLLALSHALTLWIFVGAFIFCIFHFRPRGWAAVIMLAAFVIIYTPWLVRNYAVCGNAGGIAVYSFFDGINHPEAGHMRRVDLDLGDSVYGTFKNKLINNATEQLGHIFGYLGWSFVALMFFVGLLHVFKKPETAALRWLVLSMWAGAFLGMAVYGINDELGVAANQLHLLFVPIMACYGLAYLLVQWNRLEIEYWLARISFITLVFIVSLVPTLAIPVTVFAAKKAINWPPYVPPYISILNVWMKPNEIIASDMPWAISWYADRKSLWLPDTIHAFTEFNDYNTFGAPIDGLYLTPISGSQNKLGDILKGEYRDWAGVILRSVDLQKFPLKWATLLGLENECVFFSDHDRQRITAP
ncbi:MAG: ArnT family glycosyltransferase, partial [Chthoniobacterales bacterium]